MKRQKHSWNYLIVAAVGLSEDGGGASGAVLGANDEANDLRDDGEPN